MRYKLQSVPSYLLLGRVACLAFPRDANAQSPEIALNRFEPAFAGDRLLSVQSPDTLGDNALHVEALADYAHNPLVLRRVGSSNDAGAIVSSQTFLHLNGTYALWNRLSLNLIVRLAVQRKGDSPSGGGATYSLPSSAARLTAHGYGQDKPIGDNCSIAWPGSRPRAKRPQPQFPIRLADQLEVPRIRLALCDAAFRYVVRPGFHLLTRCQLYRQLLSLVPIRVPLAGVQSIKVRRGQQVHHTRNCTSFRGNDCQDAPAIPLGTSCEREAVPGQRGETVDFTFRAARLHLPKGEIRAVGEVGVVCGHGFAPETTTGTASGAGCHATG